MKKQKTFTVVQMVLIFVIGVAICFVITNWDKNHRTYTVENLLREEWTYSGENYQLELMGIFEGAHTFYEEDDGLRHTLLYADDNPGATLNEATTLKADGEIEKINLFTHMEVCLEGLRCVGSTLKVTSLEGKPFGVHFAYADRVIVMEYEGADNTILIQSPNCGDFLVQEENGSISIIWNRCFLEEYGQGDIEPTYVFCPVGTTVSYFPEKEDDDQSDPDKKIIYFLGDTVILEADKAK